MAGATVGNPRNNNFHKYNPISRMFFCWIDSLVLKGFKGPLTEEDMYVCPPEADSQKMLEAFEKYWEKEKNTESPKLWLVFAKYFFWRIVVHGILCVLFITNLVCQGILLGYLSNYFVIEAPSSTETRSAYLFALGLSLASLSLIALNGMMGFYGYKLGMLVRIMASSAIYQKIIKLSPSRVNQLTVGHILNMVSNDIHRFDRALLFYHFIWIAPIHLAVATYFVYVEIGPTAFLGAALVLLQTPLQYFLGQIYIKLRLRAAKLTDERILIMNEIISGIRVIKMYGWEYAFHALVANVRRREVKAILKSSVINVITLSYYSISLPTMMFGVFSVYVSLDENNTLTPKKVFTTLSLFVFVRLIFLTFCVKSVVLLSEGRVALQRISKFLLLDEENVPQISDIEHSVRIPSQQKISSLKKQRSSSTSVLIKSVPDIEELLTDVGIIVNNISASWNMNESDVQNILDVSFKVDKTKPLLAVIGSVGAGKSTLLQCLLNELPPLKGSVIVKGIVAYVSQEPWIFSDTLRSNVLFGLEYDSLWYSVVIEACALEKDIDQLCDGDLTIIGERGVTLSGGQKARINLARAVYRKADIYLLDDPLSAVDAVVSRHLFDKCIKGLLSDSCIVLVTHQLQYLQQCDQILGLKEGCVTLYGDPVELLSDEADIMTLMHGEEDNSQDPRSQYAVRRCSLDQNPTAPLPTVFQSPMDAIKEEDGIDVECHNDSLNSKSVSIFHLDQVDEVFNTKFFGETGSVYSSPPLFSQTSHTSQNDKDKSEVKLQPSEETAQGTISVKTYYKYFVAGAGHIFLVFVFFVFILAECSIVVTDWWMADWADCNEDSTNVTLSRCFITDNRRIGIYFGLLSSVWLFSLLRAFLFYMLLLRAARVLHNKMFSSVIRAPILFFDSNSIGRILNRFSKDIGFLDDVLIFTFSEFIQLFSRFFGIMVIAIIANYYMSVIVIILSVAFILFRWFFLKTARSIKRIEALSRSPLYSHISLTIQGLVTVRSYNMINQMTLKFHKYHNDHTQAWYLYIVSSRWFGMRLDLISSIFVAAVALMSVPLAGSINPGLVGLALTYAISLNGMFQYCIRQSAEIESLMVSAERVLAYGNNVESEASLETNPTIGEPSLDWPNKGKIELNDVCYRHAKESSIVLNKLSAVIESGEKVGIVGRTGAGKSSLVAALFRLAEPSGSIKVDGIEILTLGLHDLRTRLSIIPQDPVLFTGSIRYNLDPFICYTDECIWRALEHVQLKWTVECLEGGLESHVSEGGSNFSVGQRQLFCLARALLRNNKVLIMDEATANVDIETDGIIQVVIREQFKDCTVLTIAHRLDTVMDSDKIMVLRFGELVEFDVPHLLLSKADSYLLRLVDHTGHEAAQKLKEMALQAYKDKNNQTAIVDL